MKSLTDQLQIAYEEGKNDGLTIAGDTRQPSPRSGRQHPVPRYGVGGYEDHPYDDFGDYRGPTIPNPNPGQGFDWAGGPKNNTKVAHRSHEPSFTHDGIPRYGWGDDSHDPMQHRTPVDDYNNPIPSLTPTDEEIDSMNGLQISGNPFGYSDEYIHRSKALREIIDGRDIPMDGDIIVKIDGELVRKIADILVHLQMEKLVGDEMVLTILRDGEMMEKTIFLGERPSN